MANRTYFVSQTRGPEGPKSSCVKVFFMTVSYTNEFSVLYLALVQWRTSVCCSSTDRLWKTSAAAPLRRAISPSCAGRI